MKTWKQPVDLPGMGLCTVKELTDRDATRERRKGVNAMPISTGFVCLYRDDVFVGTCGSYYAACAARGAPLPNHP